MNQNRIVLPSLVQRHCRHLVHIRGEFRERLEFIELSLVDLQGTGHLLHGFHLSRSTDSGDGDAHIDSRTLSLVEEGRLEVDLAVGDRDDVCRNIRGDVTGLSLDDREGRKRAPGTYLALQGVRKVIHLLGDFLLVDYLGSPLEEPGVEVEDISRVSLAA